MKRTLIILVFAFSLFSVSAFGQKGDKNQIPIDSLLEQDAKHNLNVAWQYFKLRKAYKAVLMRTEETIAAHPTFSKMDEVLYLSGMSSYYLAEGKGKQKLNPATMSKDDKKRFSPERLKQDALALLSQLVESHPESKYVKKAQKTIKKLKPKE